MRDLLIGRVTHARPASAERAHAFAYPFFGIVVRYPVEPLGRWFTHNQFGFLSFDDRDHGDRDGADLRGWLRRALDEAEAPIDLERCIIEVLSMPRVLGFVFNPVSFWFLSDAEESLVAVVAEVNNTFGGTHSYVLHRGGDAIRPSDWLGLNKAFYVSPFFQVRGGYQFLFSLSASATDVRLHHVDEQGQLLIATRVKGQRMPMTPARVARYGVAALAGVWLALLRIHLQALRLYIKGVGLVPRDRGLGRSVASLSSRSS
ncbi:MAG: DUF1365 family protein [Rhodobacterales bacterium]|nr:DUF1365 family protein [Rhodobacterales bacterium]